LVVRGTQGQQQVVQIKADDQGCLPQHYAADSKNLAILSALPSIPDDMPMPSRSIHAQQYRQMQDAAVQTAALTLDATTPQNSSRGQTVSLLQSFF
ncbi:MAG TPA: hypothetical protein VLG38_03735, partial [Gammaproteobacteria bacterium]|nr:hypothetical protein [Gammaproteobacteria bacterium]